MKKILSVLLTLTMLCSLFSMLTFAAEDDAFDLVFTRQGVSKNLLRFVVPLSSIPFEVTENSLAGMKVKRTLTNKETKEVLNMDSVVVANEMRDGSTVVVVNPTDEVPPVTYDGDQGHTHDVKLKIYPELKK